MDTVQAVTIWEEQAGGTGWYAHNFESPEDAIMAIVGGAFQRGFRITQELKLVIKPSQDVLGLPPVTQPKPFDPNDDVPF